MRRDRSVRRRFAAIGLSVGLCASLVAAPQVSRESWQRVPDIFQALAVRPGAHVADVGAGDGYFTVRLAEAVGPSGRVYAVDISQPTLDRLVQNVRSKSLTNVEAILGTPSDPRLPSGELDAVLIVNAYHEMTEHQAMLAAIRRALKPDGRLVIVEPIVENQQGTPRDNQATRHQIAPRYVQADAVGAGFVIDRLEFPFSRRPEMNLPEFLLVLTPAPVDAPPIAMQPMSFVRPEAMPWQQPDEVIAALKLAPGSTVVDLGAGGGAFTRRMAQAVGPTGRAIGLDIDPEAIAAMRKDAQTRGLLNYEARLVPADDAGLARASVDLILVSNTYHMMTGQGPYFRKLRPALRPDGRLVIIDMPPGSFGPGSAPNNFTAEAVQKTLVEAGYRLLRTHDFLEHQFFLEFVSAAK